MVNETKGELIGAAEAARIVGVSRQRIRAMAESGILRVETETTTSGPKGRRHTVRLFDRGEVERFAEARRLRLGGRVEKVATVAAFLRSVPLMGLRLLWPSYVEKVPACDGEALVLAMKIVDAGVAAGEVLSDEQRAKLNREANEWLDRQGVV